MNEVSHQRVKTNGIWLHIAEQGTGPLVLLLHGFPEIWYSWRHQITFLANHGYHVVAPDLRGYGDSDSPLSPISYTVMHLVGDIIGLLDHFGEQQAFIVGHDWGAVIGWHLALYILSHLVKIWDVHDVVDEPGRAERAFARYDYLTVIKKFLLITQTDNLIAPPGMEIIDYLRTPSRLPPWITEEELQVYADKFQESGFTGALNYYRAMDLNWELTAPWQGSKITVPVKFMVGKKDLGFEASGVRQYVEGNIFRSLVPNLEIVILDGHHFLQQEKHQEVSEEILSFLRKFPAE
ncbi:bifunctional epoxide hydrolase 2-like [Gossypium australe]|uniref:Bifunctional epoxide hydrolase 2-like n=1 Tax=Gossypium australe TaxID=47621 RepID=A0A5B6VYN2_9ROSI|nr:bifunctional epoxide hydrolase 2-like [Gossypium australe]